MGNCCGLCAKKDTADSFVKVGPPAESSMFVPTDLTESLLQLTPDEVERRREIQVCTHHLFVIGQIYLTLYDHVCGDSLLSTSTVSQAKAADERAKEFKHGGGGEKVKAKQKKLEEAQKKNKDIGGPDMLRAGLFE